MSKKSTPIYRMIHAENLPHLLEWGGDYSPNQCERQRLKKRAIHHTHIMDRRQTRTVPCGAGGTLADYVPFYFRFRSPMLYAINKGQVAGYSGQREIVYLKSSAERVAAEGVNYAFSDGHAVIEYADFYDDLSNLNQVPWDAVNAKYWKDLEDGRFKCQAEFLVRDFFSFGLVDQIVVYDDSMKEWVQSHLDSRSIPLTATVQNAWYF